MILIFKSKYFRNATEAMDLADNWLGVPKLLTPEEIINPNVDEQSMMTYLSQFPNAKVKEGAPFREKALASKVRAHGPGNIALFRLYTGCQQKRPHVPNGHSQPSPNKF